MSEAAGYQHSLEIKNGNYVFDEIVRTTEPRLLQLAYSITRNRDTAEDVVQGAYLKAYEGLQEGSFRGESTIETWLYHIVNNVAIDVWRKQQRLRMVHPDFTSVVDRRDDPIHMVENEEEQRYRNRKVRAALQALSEEQRIPIQLFYLLDQSYEEIASAMNVAVGTIKSRVHYGKKRLKPLLEEFADAA